MRTERIVDLARRHTAGVVIIGPPASGTTSLAIDGARALLAEAGGGEPVVIRGTAAAADIDFGAFMPALASLATETVGTDRLSMLRAVVDVVADRGNVVVVDDAHLLDASSAAALASIVEHGCTIVATTQSDAALLPVLRDHLRSRRMARLDVDYLDEGGVGRLFASLTGRRPTASTRRRCTDLSGGSPVLLSTILRLADPALELRDTMLHWNSPLAVDTELSTIIEALLEPLDAETREAFDVVAIAAPLGVAVLVELVGAHAVDAIERSGLVIVDDATDRSGLVIVHDATDRSGNPTGRRKTARLRFGVCEQVVRTALSSVRFTEIARNVADAIDAVGARRADDLVRTTSHRLAATGAGNAADLEQAARVATLAFDDVLCERLARAAIDAGGGPGAAFALVFALGLQNRVDESEAVMQQWWRPVLDTANPDIALLFAFRRVLNLHLSLGRVADAASAIGEATESLNTERSRQQLTGLDAFVTSHVDAAAGAAIGRPLIDDDDADPLGRIHAAHAVAAAAAERGMTDDAVDVVVGVRSDASDVADYFPRGPGFVNQLYAQVLLDAEHPDAVAAVAEELLPRPQSGARLDLVRVGTTWSIIGVGRYLSGDLAGAVTALDAATAHLSVSDGGMSRPQTLCYLALAHAELGDRERAVETIEAARSYRDTQHHRVRYRTLLARTEAWVAASTDVRHGRALALDAAAGCTVPVDRAWLWFTAHRLGSPWSEIAEPLISLTAGMQSPLMQAFGHHAQVAVSGGDLEPVADRYAQIGMYLLAAETLVEAGARSAEAGNGQRRRRTWAAATDLLQRHSVGAHTPAIQQLIAPLLTERERLIGRQAAQGATNAEIAATVGRSVRTVEWHLQQIYTKLGVRSRADLGSTFELSGD